MAALVVDARLLGCGGRHTGKHTLIRRETFTLLNDEEGRRLGVHDRKFDASKPPVDTDDMTDSSRKIGHTHLSSAASSLTGTPVCIVCMRRT